MSIFSMRTGFWQRTTTWDWGDGTPPTAGGPMVNHVYNNPGAYTATMKFTDTENAVGTATVIIKVLAMP
jgi:PKD repeat protein